MSAERSLTDGAALVVGLDAVEPCLCGHGLRLHEAVTGRPCRACDCSGWKPAGKQGRYR